MIMHTTKENPCENGSVNIYVSSKVGGNPQYLVDDINHMASKNFASSFLLFFKQEKSSPSTFIVYKKSKSIKTFQLMAADLN